MLHSLPGFGLRGGRRSSPAGAAEVLLYPTRARYTEAMLLYLDMCCLSRPLDDRSQQRVEMEGDAILAILEFCDKGGAEWMLSEALEDEASQIKNAFRKDYVRAIFLMASGLQRVEPGVRLLADDFTARGLKELDALHLACAVTAKADYFCTCDDRLLKKARLLVVPPMKAVSPLELLTELNL